MTNTAFSCTIILSRLYLIEAILILAPRMKQAIRRRGDEKLGRLRLRALQSDMNPAGLWSIGPMISRSSAAPARGPGRFETFAVLYYG
jgi:hypothetical protein